jgi:hypothetical protein
MSRRLAREMPVRMDELRDALRDSLTGGSMQAANRHGLARDIPREVRPVLHFLPLLRRGVEVWVETPVQVPRFPSDQRRYSEQDGHQSQC